LAARDGVLWARLDGRAMAPASEIAHRGVSRRLALCVTLLALAACAATLSTGSCASGAESTGVRLWTIHYIAHNGADRLATVILPAWYGPRNDPPLPLVISPHGRGGNGRTNAELWGDLPAVGGFAVVNPDGMGRLLRHFSYGYAGQIDDLARMPGFVTKALPWLHVDSRRIYALGSSMGGQETLLLVARHPHLLAGAAAMDSVTDMTRRYRQLPTVPCSRSCLQHWRRPYGLVLQSTMRREVGGAPEGVPGAYATRSPLSLAPLIAASGVPLQIWWSREDHIVSDQKHQSEALLDELLRLNSCAPVSGVVGRWAHSTEMRADSLLPIALARFGLLPRRPQLHPRDVELRPAPSCSA
jgi:pimeloyl-ACP methyl ester carboxylesterase